MTARAMLNIEALRQGLIQLQDDLASGKVSLDSVFASTDATAEYLYVVKALESVPGVGKVRARAILSDLGIAEHAHCGDLAAGERRAICDRIGISS